MSEQFVSRHFCVIQPATEKLQLHYRKIEKSGAKATIVMLHPSPLSSSFMQPMMQVFAQNHSVIAWDAPGYGESDSLPTGGKTLSEYVESLKLFIDALGLDSVILYGNATGAQIAIEFGKTYPAVTTQIILENAALFTDEERDEYMASYFPSIAPTNDGSHLTQVWDIVSKLFCAFPWYDDSEQAKLNMPLPPISVLQATAMDYLRAGEGYGNAYAAALHNEKPAKIQALTSVKTDVVLWHGSIINKYCQRLCDIDLPNNITLHQVVDGMAERVEKLKEISGDLCVGFG